MANLNDDEEKIWNDGIQPVVFNLPRETAAFGCESIYENLTDVGKAAFKERFSQNQPDGLAQVGLQQPAKDRIINRAIGIAKNNGPVGSVDIKKVLSPSKQSQIEIVLPVSVCSACFMRCFQSKADQWKTFVDLIDLRNLLVFLNEEDFDYIHSKL